MDFLPRSFRLLRTIAVLVCLLRAHSLVAQPKPPTKSVPFPIGSFTDPEKFMGQMFGASTPEEEQTLAEIKISVQDERQFGEQCVTAYLASLKQQKLKVIRKGKDVDYLVQLVQTLQPFMTNAKRYHKITVYVVDSPTVDARSFPGGTLFFFRGLLSLVDNEAELIGIVGHELSHLDHGHQLLPLKRAKIFQQKLAGGMQPFDPQKFFTEGTSMFRLLGRPFRPEDEVVADADGAAWSYRAGYDPRELAQLFAKLQQQHKQQPTPLASFFQTHPYNEARYAAIMDQYDELQQANPQQSLYRGQKNLATRTAKSQQEFPD